MATQPRIATVFGGAGFIGRYVVKRLAAAGYQVRVGCRRPDRALVLKPMGGVGQIVPLAAPVNDAAAVERAVAGADVVVNLVGILAERRQGDFARVHVDGAAAVAKAAAAAGVRCLVHLSAIGADPASSSAYGASKGRGEQAVRAAFPNATILRPSVVFGPEDHFFNRFAGMARTLPVMPVISGGTKLQPVYVGDVADAVLAAMGHPGETYELAGPAVMSFRDIITWIMRQTGHERPAIALPMCLARLQAAILERLPGKLLTRDQLRMLARDNIAAADMPGLAQLGIVPTPIDLVVPDYLRRFRPGGGRRASAGQPA